MYGGSGWTDTPMPLCHIVCFCVFDRGSGGKMPDFWRNLWEHKEVIKSNTEVLKGHLSLTWKSVFVLLKTGICFQKSEFVLQNGRGGVVFKNVVERFNYCIVKRQFSNSDFLKQIPWFTNADFWKQTPIFKLRVLKTNFGFQSLIFGKKLPFTTLIYETKLLFSNSEFLKQTLIFEKKFQFFKTKKKTTIFKSNLDVSLKLWNDNVAQKSYKVPAVACNWLSGCWTHFNEVVSTAVGRASEPDRSERTRQQT